MWFSWIQVLISHPNKYLRCFSPGIFCILSVFVVPVLIPPHCSHLVFKAAARDHPWSPLVASPSPKPVINTWIFTVWLLLQQHQLSVGWYQIFCPFLVAVFTWIRNFAQWKTCCSYSPPLCSPADPDHQNITWQWHQNSEYLWQQHLEKSVALTKCKY